MRLPPADPAYKQLPKATRQRIDREVKAQMEKEIAREIAYFKARPLIAAYYILPGIACLVHFDGAGEKTVKFMLRELRRMPCPSWALREALQETRRMVNTLPSPPSSDTTACQAWKTMQAVAQIPDDFWEALLTGLPHKKKPKSRQTA